MPERAEISALQANGFCPSEDRADEGQQEACIAGVLGQ
jgi:hypothetical protein